MARPPAATRIEVPAVRTTHRPQRPVRVKSLALVGAALAVLCASVVSGCTLDETGPPATQVSGWLTTSGGGSAVGQVEADTRNIQLAIVRHDTAKALRTVCALLTTDAQTAIGNLPTPDTQLTNDLNAAYEDAASAGNDCYNGANGNASLLHRSAVERAKVVPMLGIALERIASITGHTPSTSTTAPADSGDDPFSGS
ncbi:MAG: hypothetical protein ABSC41_00120 [Acidimicrobiales bacterium]